MITVLSDGTFDGLHFGHIAHLQQARALGDRLIVALATDEAVHRRKGLDRPRFPYQQRASMLQALSCVDAVVPCDDSQTVVADLRPDIYVKGTEYKGVDGHLQLGQVAALVESYGGRVAYVGETLASSTDIIHELGPLSGTAAQLALTRQEVYDWLDKARLLSPIVLGELIADQYHYVEPEGKSPKEEVITYRETGVEEFLGGATAVWNHLSHSCTSPMVISNHKPILKMRYVTKPFYRKLFSVVREATVPHFVDRTFPGSGFLVVADFGHGLLDKEDATWIAARPGFLALTVQSNSLNWGYNLLTKWPRADYFVADEQELRLACSDRAAPVNDLLAREHSRLRARYSAVTLGHKGCLVYDGQQFFELPALTTRVVDRLGAGDAFLAWTAPLACVGAPLEVIGLVGNIAGAIKVGTVGNKEPVTMAQVKRWVKGILP